MLKFFSKKPKKENSEKKHVSSTQNNNSEQNSQGFLSKLANKLKKTRSNFTEKLATLILGKKTIDAEILEEIETYLLAADVGVETTEKIIECLTQKVNRKDLDNPESLFNALKQELMDILKPCEQPLDELNIKDNTPFVILMAGVNGAGKTTTIGKIAKKLEEQGKKVMLAAGDTFRAAAIEQLKTWGERNNVPVIHQTQGSDSASVIYDAYNAAKARNYDVLIADTAGRLHTQENLMAELKKIVKVIKKIDANAPHETMLVLDASLGQNSLNQAKKFNDAIKLSGIALTKMDGTAKGGIIFAIANELNLPIRYIGVGEKIEDLRNFKAQDFIEALFTK